MVVAFRFHNQQSDTFREEQQQNANWTGLYRRVCSCFAFPVGGGAPIKVCTKRLWGLGECPLRELWLLTFHIAIIILIFRAAGRKIWALVASRCPLCQQMRNVSSRRCPNSLRILVIDSATVHEPVSHATAHHIAFCGKL